MTLPELNSGGVESHVFCLARALKEEGHHVVVVSAGGQKADDLEKAGVIHYQLDVKRKSLFTVLQAVVSMKKIIKDEDIQLVHAHSRVPAWIGYYAARKEGIPFLTTAHSHYSIHLGSKSMVKGERIIAVSQSVAEHLHHGFQIPYEKMILIRPAIDIEAFERGSEDRLKTREELGIKKDEIVIGNVARLSSLKGHQYLLQAAAIIRDKLVSDEEKNRYRLLIVGDGPERDGLERLAEDLNIMAMLIFTGQRNDIPRLLAAMDIFVLSSTKEGLGLSAVEAMAARKPVILTDCCGIAKDISDGKEGLLVPAAEPDKLAFSIYQLSKQHELMEDLAKRGNSFAKKYFSINRMVEDTVMIYHDLIKDKNGG